VKTKYFLCLILVFGLVSMSRSGLGKSRPEIIDWMNSIKKTYRPAPHERHEREQEKPDPKEQTPHASEEHRISEILDKFYELVATIDDTLGMTHDFFGETKKTGSVPKEISGARKEFRSNLECGHKTIEKALGSKYLSLKIPEARDMIVSEWEKAHNQKVSSVFMLQKQMFETLKNIVDKIEIKKYTENILTKIVEPILPKIRPQLINNIQIIAQKAGVEISDADKLLLTNNFILDPLKNLEKHELVDIQNQKLEKHELVDIQNQKNAYDMIPIKYLYILSRIDYHLRDQTIIEKYKKKIVSLNNQHKKAWDNWIKKENKPNFVGSIYIPLEKAFSIALVNSIPASLLHQLKEKLENDGISVVETNGTIEIGVSNIRPRQETAN